MGIRKVIVEQVISMYETKGLNPDSDVVKMDLALRFNKNLLIMDGRNYHYKNKNK